MMPTNDLRSPTWLIVAAVILLGVLAIRCTTNDLGPNPNAGGSGTPINAAANVGRPVEARGDLASDERSTIELYRRISPSVVNITASTLQRSPFSLDVTKIPQGTGSGFVWDKDGHVVTNFHVIQDAQAADVTLAGQTTWKANLIGVAPDYDLAVLKIEAPADRLPPIPLGTSADLQVGQKVYAIGNPFGLDQTLTTGVISGLGREIESVTRRPIRGVIQTDAAINPGNSGGPLLDSAGRLIGVNTAIYSPSGAYAGVGFAVPVDLVNRVVPQLISDGKITRVGLGVTVAEDTLARSLGIKGGVLVLSVRKGGPADKAGLRETVRDERGRVQLGDLITAVNNQPVRTSNDLYKAFENRQSGDAVELTLQRGTAESRISVVLAPLD